MDKPMSMSVKDYLIRILSARTNTPVKIIEAVVTHQMNGMNKAMQTPGIHSIEMSGFAKFIFNHKKAKKKFDKNLSKEKLFTDILNKPDLTDKQKSSYTLKLENTIKWMEEIKPKIEACLKLQNI